MCDRCAIGAANFSTRIAFVADESVQLLATRVISGQLAARSMSKSSAVVKAGVRAMAAVGIGGWIALSFACSDATPTKTLVQVTDNDASATVVDAGTEDAADEPPGPQMYNGAPAATQAPTMSGSIAAPDGSCPLPDSLSEYGLQCPSCAKSHCSSALSECDPTMVNACTEYYCPAMCASSSSSSSGAMASACPLLASCCPMLFGTLLNSQCLAAQASGVASQCASVLTQAQSSGHCM
jgi:hypothetical protein